MIIRKPYAFLIRNFKFIHLFMFIISLYILYKSGVMLSFSNDYVSTREVLEDIATSDYISFLLYFSTILIIILSTSIYILFKEKDKPVTFYLFNIIYYVIFFALCIVSSSLITTIIKEGIDPRIARILRDFWLIAIALQVYFVIIYLIRAIGFDFKKFNFGEDLAKLKIEEEDSEEIEINANVNTEKAKMRLAMQREEFKAFVIEYKVIIIIIFLVLFVVIPAILINKKIELSKVYESNEVIVMDDYEFSIIDSYITKRDYSGNDIYQSDNSFVIVKFKVKNNSDKDLTLTLNNIRLEVDNSYYLPESKYNNNFIDLGKCYESQIISNEGIYLVIYIVKDDILDKELKVRYTKELGFKDGEAVGKYYHININPVNIDKTKNVINYNLTDNLVFSDIGFNNVIANINTYEISDYYTYSYNNSVKQIINNNGLLLKLNYNFTYDSNDSVTSFSDLLVKYAVIKYTYGDRTYINSINIASSNGYSGNDIFLKVSNDIKSATSITIEFNLRNNKYIYKIK